MGTLPPLAFAIDTRLDTHGAVVPGQPTTLTLDLIDIASGQPATNIAVAHEAPVHLIVVNNNLSTFAHLHPQPTGRAGQYEVGYPFPAVGDYTLYAEFEVAGRGDEVHRFSTRAGDQPSAVVTLAPDLAPQQSGALTATLQPVGDLRAGQPAQFVVWIKEGDQIVTDLAPYLGAAGHVVVMGARANNFAHVHAVAGDTPPGTAMGGMGVGDSESEMAPPAQFGPQVAFSHTFDKPGLYKVWVQFQRAGQVHTVAWVVEVK
jgi:Cu+-exporting ATPase